MLICALCLAVGLHLLGSSNLLGSWTSLAVEAANNGLVVFLGGVVRYREQRIREFEDFDLLGATFEWGKLLAFPYFYSLVQIYLWILGPMTSFPSAIFMTFACVLLAGLADYRGAIGRVDLVRLIQIAVAAIGSSVVVIAALFLLENLALFVLPGEVSCSQLVAAAVVLRIVGPPLRSLWEHINAERPVFYPGGGRGTLGTVDRTRL